MIQLGVEALGEHGAALADVPLARREERLPLVVVGRVDEEAGEQHGVERPAQVELLDVRQVPFEAGVDVVQHRLALIDHRDPVPLGLQRVGDAARSATEVEHGRRRWERSVEQVGRRSRRQDGERLDRAPVRRIGRFGTTRRRCRAAVWCQKRAGHRVASPSRTTSSPRRIVWTTRPVSVRPV